MKMDELKKLDIEEIENKVVELKGSLLKNNIAKLNQGEFDTNIFNKIKKDIARCMTEINMRNKGKENEQRQDKKVDRNSCKEFIR